MAEDLSEMPTFCKVCRGGIPEDRAKRRASTCSEECLAKVKKKYRHRFDNKFCRFCLRPATRDERALFNRWRKFQANASPLLQQLVAAIENPDAVELRKTLEGLHIVPTAKALASLRSIASDQARPPVGAPEKKGAPDDDGEDEQQHHADEPTPAEVVQ